MFPRYWNSCTRYIYTQHRDIRPQTYATEFDYLSYLTNALFRHRVKKFNFQLKQGPLPMFFSLKFIHISVILGNVDMGLCNVDSG